MKAALVLALVVASACAGLGQETPADWVKLPAHQGFWRGRSVQYKVIDGFAVVEGDIILGPADELEERTESTRKIPVERETSVISGAVFRWTNATIPYVIDPALPNAGRVFNAIRHWEERTFVRFVERSEQANYVTIRPAAGGCNSNLGMRGGQQFINLGAECATGSVVHELGHTVGLYHTQSRIDRDRYLRVEYQNIDRREWSQYNQHIVDGDDLGPYDYASIMQYSSFGFANSNLPAMTTVPPGIPIGQRSELSPGDVQGVYQAYGRSLAPVTITSTPPGMPIVVDGQTVITPKQFAWEVGESHTISAPDTLQLLASLRLRFARWSDESDREHTITVAADRVYSAQFSIQYAFRTAVNPADGGTVSVSPASDDGFYNQGTVLSISAKPAESYNFLGWTPGPGSAIVQALNGLGLSANPSVLPISRDDLFYTAMFTQEPVTVVTSSPEGRTINVDGAATITPRAFAWSPGTTHTLEVARPLQLGWEETARYQFQQWSTGETGEIRWTASADNSTVIASFRTQYPVTKDLVYIVIVGSQVPSVTENFRINPPSADGFYDAGSSIQLTATDGAGFSFSNWIGDASGQLNPHQLSVNSQLVVAANFLTAPRISPNSIVNDASLQPGPVSAGEILTIFGPLIGPDAEQLGILDSNGRPPSTLAGRRVLFDDLPAGMLSASRNRLRVRVPTAIAGRKTVQLTVVVDGLSLTPRTIGVLPATPALYTADGSGTGPAVVLGPDGKPLSAAGQIFRGDTITLEANGLGSGPVRVFLNEVGLEDVVVKERPDAPGVLRITAVVPHSAPTGVTSLILTAGVQSSPYAVTLLIAP